MVMRGMTLGAAVMEHVRDVRAAMRAVPDAAAEPGALAVDRARVLSFRATATHLPNGGRDLSFRGAEPPDERD
jgi:hypothetical protein